MSTSHVMTTIRTRMVTAVLISGLSAPLLAQTEAGGATALREEIRALREEQQALQAAQRRLAERLAALEARLPADEAPAPAAAGVTPDDGPAKASERFEVSGDLRLRTQSDRDAEDEAHIAQLRGRLKGSYRVSDALLLGARLVTGNPDDPNSTEVTFGDWLDDFELSLDQAYVQYDAGRLSVFGGKLPQPFERTDLVWDGDVNPQGAAAVHAIPLAGGTLHSRGLLFLVDEQSGGDDSVMGGVQLGHSARHGTLEHALHAAYYRYDLGSVAGADASDWRSNRLREDGHFLSDYELVDLLAQFEWSLADPRWPLQLTADYVRNLGAYDDRDTGFGAELGIGRGKEAGDWVASYGYWQAEVDAVLAAFSHNNIGLATNYRLHQVKLAYTATPATEIGAEWYRYRPLDAALEPDGDDGWRDRLRIYLMLRF